MQLLPSPPARRQEVPEGVQEAAGRVLWDAGPGAWVEAQEAGTRTARDGGVSRQRKPGQGREEEAGCR